MEAMAPERRGLFESILLLLYKLALNSGGSHSEESPSGVMSTILARPSEGELVEILSDRQRIGRFLIENAPELLHRQDEVQSVELQDSLRLESTRFVSEDEDSSHDGFEYQARRPSSGDERDRGASMERLLYTEAQNPSLSPVKESSQQPLSISQSPKRRRRSLAASATVLIEKLSNEQLVGAEVSNSDAGVISHQCSSNLSAYCSPGFVGQRCEHAPATPDRHRRVASKQARALCRPPAS